MSDDDTAVASRPTMVRMSARPPPRFTVNSDFNLWWLRFELYVQQNKIPEAEWVKELLPLLEDEPFRVVNRMGLASSTDVKAVKECLEQRYAPKGTELEWQLKLQTRVQQRDEPLSDFAGHLKLLASKAYPDS